MVAVNTNNFKGFFGSPFFCPFLKGDDHLKINETLILQCLKALIDKVIIKSPKKFVFIFESGYEVEMES
jgi:hypothetical protein